MTTIDDEREQWVVYTNLYILKLGGVPAPCDMQTFAPKLWQEETKTKATYFVWNDEKMDPERYIKQTKSVGFRANMDDTKRDASEILDEDGEMELCVLKTELWLMAADKLKTTGRESFDTSGLSAHGIVPPRPAFI